jgi:hypothetical protein
MISLSVSGGPLRDLKEEAERFDAFVRLLQDESVLMGREYGFFLYRDGFRVLEWYEVAEEAINEAADAAEAEEDNVVAALEEADERPVGGYWRPLQSRVFKFEHEFPENIEILAWVEEAELDLVEMVEDEELIEALEEAATAEKVTPAILTTQRKAAQLAPTVLFLSSGEATAYRIRLSLNSDPEQRFEVISDVVGKITFVKPGETYEGE